MIKKKKICTCCDCGHQWEQGQDGGHSCVYNLKSRILKLEKAIEEHNADPYAHPINIKGVL